MSDKDEAKTTIGCTIAILGLFVTLPMWYVLLFCVLDATNQPVWVWALYWAYVPVAFITSALAKIHEAM